MNSSVASTGWWPSHPPRTTRALRAVMADLLRWAGRSAAPQFSVLLSAPHRTPTVPAATSASATASAALCAAAKTSANATVAPRRDD